MKTPEEIKKGIRQCLVRGEMKPISREEMLRTLSEHDILRIEMDKDGITYILNPIQRTCLNTLRDAIYEDAVEHGLWDEHYTATDCVDFIRGEVIELECAAMDWMDGYIDSSEFCQELADVIIMSLSVAGYMRIDIDAAVRRKMEINRARPWKHGKEK